VTKIDKAIEFATKAHRNQFRKGTELPYISHPFSVAMLLREMGCDEEIVIAGVLHDVVEDTDYSLDDIEKKFGKRVAEIVNGCSEPDRNASWESRKKHTIEYLKNAPYEIKIVSCADKLHNIRTIRRGFNKTGHSFWDLFHRGFESQKWYYLSLVKSLYKGLDKSKNIDIFHQFRQEVELIFESE
jgi:(p)ppGpp synthase/HD superfamily hydrolase